MSMEARELGLNRAALLVAVGSGSSRVFNPFSNKAPSATTITWIRDQQS
jgi:hypothetical protein